ncbi:MAG: ABC-type uncharacterized transport system involved in gliding motility auxiliary subunit [Bacteroidia bacterium]|jgi:ABC-type uncharacterized transport system involved in gliding motility auxiliary subunit/ABC-type transport system involved in multi-copper enzyme maturation permease subunit
MKSALPIWIRELKALLRTPTAYLYLITFSLLANLLVLGMSSLFTRGQADLAPLFDALPWLALLLTPAITMGLWSEELRSGSIELLFTLPLKTSEVVLGKFLAAWTFALIALGTTLTLLVSVAYLGEADLGALIAGYIGSALLLGAFAALGAFVSTTTRSTPAAFVLSVTLGFLFLFSDVASIREVLEGTLGAGPASAFANLSLSSHFEAIGRGVVGLDDLLFFCAFIALFLFASVAVLEARRKGSPRKSAGSIALFAAIFLALNLGAGPALSKLESGRLDFTEAGLYSLSDGSRKVAQEIGYDVTLDIYLSRSTSKKSPQFAGFAEHMLDLVERFGRAATGEHTIRINQRDPAPFSEDEYEAQFARLTRQATGLGGADANLYFGIVGTNSVGDIRRIPFLSPDREGRIEYELARILQELGHPERPRVGVISSLPVLTGGLQARGWQIIESARGSFDFQDIADPGQGIPDKIDVLAVIHPRDLDEAGRKAIDAFAVAGGALLIALDPLAEVDTEEMDKADYTAGYVAKRHSQMPKLLEAWGIELVQRKIVADRELGLRIPKSDGTGELNNVHVIELGPQHLATDDGAIDPVTGSLGRLLFWAAGNLVTNHIPEGVTVTPLLQSTAASMNLDVSILQVIKDADALLAYFVADGKRRNLALRVRGKVPSAYENEVPANQQPMTAIVVSDVDLFSDNTWIGVDERNGVNVGLKPTADNGRFFLEALGDLASGSAVAAIRPKGRYTRPFARLDDMRRLAAEEIALELKQAQVKEQELRTARVKADTDLAATGQRSSNTKTRALKDELIRAQDELRRLQYEQGEEVDQLLAKLTKLNLLVGPGLACLLFLTFRRRKG